MLHESNSQANTPILDRSIDSGNKSETQSLRETRIRHQESPSRTAQLSEPFTNRFLPGHEVHQPQFSGLQKGFQHPFQQTQQQRNPLNTIPESGHEPIPSNHMNEISNHDQRQSFDHSATSLNGTFD